MDIRELTRSLQSRGVTRAQIGQLALNGRLDDAIRAPFLDDTRMQDLVDEADDSDGGPTDPHMADTPSEATASTWSDPRYWALSRTLTALGNGWSEVRRFRSDAWDDPDKVLTPDEAAAWVTSQVEHDRAQQHESRFHRLEWGVPGIHEHLFVVPAWPGTLLDRLRRTADVAGRRVPPWRQADAALFVLTGETAPIPALRGWIETADYALDGMRRVILQVSPAAPVDRVAAFYSRMRDQALAGTPARRRLDEKSAELAVFTLNRRMWATRGNGSPSWADGMRRWNQLHPEWAYDHSGHFSRDCGAACERVGVRPNDLA